MRTRLRASDGGVVADDFEADLVDDFGNHGIDFGRHDGRTYIRTLVDDLGEVLGCGAHVTVLRRTAVADYPTEKMMTWDALQALAEQGDLAQLDQHLLPIDTAVSKLPALQLDADQSKGIGFGQRVKFANEAKLHGQVRLFSDENIFLGVAVVDYNNVIRPQRLITQSL